MWKKLRWILGAIVVLLLAGVIGFVVWASDASQPQATAQAILAQDNVVLEDGVWHFQSGSDTKTALIFYQGGKVDARAYAPLANGIAETGYDVFLPEMTLNLAVLDMNRADEIIAAHPEIERWIIGGHSLGGVFAAQFASGNLEKIDGLLLLASYPTEGGSLAETTLPVVSVFASEDALATPDEINESREFLPTSARFVEIAGGNHAQFGDYGAQDGDGVATISADSQTQQTIRAAVELLVEVSGGR